MRRVYLDNCSLNRPYDDQTQIRISLETEAKLYIQTSIANGKLEMAWSYMLYYENSKNTNIAKRNAILNFAKNAVIVTTANPSIIHRAKEIGATGIKAADALHIACAIDANCDCFITTDDRVLKYRSDSIQILDPIDFIRFVEN